MSAQTTELTIRSAILAAILAIVLAASNAYLGLKVGITVSASIPAAILAMSLLKFCRNYSVLESNIVQTGASAGEALISGIMFVLPALLLLGYWQQFSYWETVAIALMGGGLGTLFSVPLRRVLLNDPSLKFPEGTAIGQVLKVGQVGGMLRELTQGGILGSVISVCQTGFQCINHQLALWFHASHHLIYGVSLGFEPALLAAGYIVGIEVALSMLLGLVINWLGIPFFSWGQDWIAVNAESRAMEIWQECLRPMGIGVMLIGGIETIIRLFQPIRAGLRSSIRSLKGVGLRSNLTSVAQEQDFPIHYTLAGILLLLVPTGFLLSYFLQNRLTLPTGLQITVLGASLILLLMAGFFFSALGGYFAGLLGSSNSPISSVSLLSLLLSSLLLVGLLGYLPSLTQNARQLLAAQGFAIILGTIITSASAITNNTIQDLKAGQMIGATPWKQQAIMGLGVVISAFIIAPVLSLLYHAYGIGSVFPRAGMDPTQALTAPQASLMATLVQGAFSHRLPWDLIGTGCVIGFICVFIDRVLQIRGKRLPVLAVGSGIYLPGTATSAVILGGLLAWIVNGSLRRAQLTPAASELQKQKGITMACGLVAGSSLMGVALAIPFTLAQSTYALRLGINMTKPLFDGLGVFFALLVLCWIYWGVCRKK